MPAPQLFPGFGTGTPSIVAHLYREKHSYALNLGPYITSIQTEKNMGEPAGMFNMTLAYAPDSAIDSNLHIGSEPIVPVKSILDMEHGAQPFDYLEMTVQDIPSPDRPTHYFRGFIDTITFSQSGGGGNDMSRQIQISGRDYGSLMQNFQVNYMQPGMYGSQNPGGAGGQALMYALSSAWTYGSSGAKFDQKSLEPVEYKYLIHRDVGSTADFVYFINDVTVNHNHIRNIKLRYNDAIKYIMHYKMVPSNLGTYIRDQNLMAFEGSLDDLIRQVQNPPWAEYFIRDEGPPINGPVMYYRIAPLLNQRGQFAWRDNANLNYGDIQWIEISRDDIIDISVSKSQNEVYTAFYTAPNNGLFPTDFQALTTGLIKWGGLGNPWNDALSHMPDKVERFEKFGYRLYQINSSWVFGELDPKNKGHNKKTGPNDLLDFLNITRHLNLWLVETLGNMEDLYSGTITHRGVSGARIGDYIFFQDDPDVPGLYFYVQGVSVDWHEGSPISETLQVIRGQSACSEDPLRRVSQVQSLSKAQSRSYEY